MTTGRERVLARSEHRGCDVAATVDQLRWVLGGSHGELPWWAIEQAFWASEEEQLRVIPAEGPSEPLALPVSPDSQVPEVVRERVMASIIASIDLEVGAGVRATYRATPTGVRVQLRWRRPEQAEGLEPLLALALRESAATLGLDPGEITPVTIQ